MPDSKPLLSLGAAGCAIKEFKALVGGWVRWETCSWVRRQCKDGPMALTHLVNPAAPRDDGPPADNGVWQSILPLLKPGGPLRGPSPDADTIALEVRDKWGWRHTIVRTVSEAWGVRLAQHTGPPGYWRMLLWRMELAGAMKLHYGQVCVVDRSGPAPRYEPIPVRDETTFFKLARTAYRDPRDRYARPPDMDDDRGNWPRGMLAEWYPPDVKVYASIDQPGLFDNSRPADPRFIGPDSVLWRHS